MAAVTLWVCTVYLVGERKFYFLTLFPALFMTMVVVDFLLISPTTFHLPEVFSHITAAVVTVAALIAFIVWKRRRKIQPQA